MPSTHEAKINRNILAINIKVVLVALTEKSVSKNDIGFIENIIYV